MIIGIDARFMLKERRGIGNYSLFMLRELVDLPTEHRFILYTDRPANVEIKGLLRPHITIRQIQSKNYLLWEQVMLPLQLRRDHVDLYHGLGNTGPYQKPGHCRLLITVHDVMFLKKELSKSTLYHRLGKIYRSSMLKGSVSKIDKIITVSEFSKQDIIEELKIESDKVIAILESYNSFFGEEVTVEKKPELPFVLALGAADERKNVAGIVKAFAAIAEETNANLLIVGYSNWETSKVYGTVKQLGIENRVKFSGFVSDEALRDLYHRAACFAYVSLYEGFGIPVLEAMAAGCPVVASQTTSIPEVAGNAAVLVDPLDTQQIGRALLALLEDEKARNHYRQAGLQRAAAFSWQETARQTLLVYDSFA